MNINEEIDFDVLLRSKQLTGLRDRVKRGEQCPLLAIDATPRTIYDANGWSDDPLNAGLTEPKYLAANRIHHFVPHAKALLILRNPIARTISDHRFFDDDQHADVFHAQVERGIAWWHRCVKLYSERACAFSYHFGPDLEDLPPDKRWDPNGGGRLRLSLYIIYIEKWLEVFPRENLLLVNSDTLDSRPVELLHHTVFPFLELEPLSAAANRSLDELLKQGHLHQTTDQGLTPHQHTIDLLENFYQPYNERLAKYANDQSFLWTQ